MILLPEFLRYSSSVTVDTDKTYQYKIHVTIKWYCFQSVKTSIEDPCHMLPRRI